MKKKIVALVSCVLIAGMLVGCTQAERASYNLSKEADNFNDVRRLTVINCLQGDVLFQMEGRMSITADIDDNQLEVIVENGEDDYSKHFVGLSDNVTYVIGGSDGSSRIKRPRCVSQWRSWFYCERLVCSTVVLPVRRWCYFRFGGNE